VAERHDDLRPTGVGAKVLDDPLPQAAGGVAGQDRDPLGVEEDHAGPADPTEAAVARREIHHEEVSLVVE
jgi:hypothetical protein